MNEYHTCEHSRSNGRSVLKVQLSVDKQLWCRLGDKMLDFVELFAPGSEPVGELANLGAREDAWLDPHNLHLLVHLVERPPDKLQAAGVS